VDLAGDGIEAALDRPGIPGGGTIAGGLDAVGDWISSGADVVGDAVVTGIDWLWVRLGL